MAIEVAYHGEHKKEEKTMNSAAEILVIILSAFLALFLLLAIILTVKLIQISNQIKKVTESAQRTVEGVERAALSISKLASPALLAKIVMKQVKRYREKMAKR